MADSQPHPRRHTLLRRESRKSPTKVHMTNPSSLEDRIEPSNLPSGWVTLNPATDMLPRFPEYEGTSVKNCQGAVPLFLDGTTVKAVVLNATSGDLSVEDTTGWDASTWNARGEAWLTGDDHNKYLSMNWDSNEYVSQSGLGGVVYVSWGNVITTITGPDIQSASANSDSTVPKQFTMALRWSPYNGPVVTDIDNSNNDRRLYIWGGFVRKDASGTSVRHMSEFDDKLRIENVYDAQDSAMYPGQWYTLSYSDEDVIATPVPKGTYMAYQAVLQYFSPVNALAVDADLKAHLASLADPAPPRRSIDLVAVLVGVAFLFASVLLVFLNGVVQSSRSPAWYLVLLIGGAVVIHGIRGYQDRPM